MNTKVICDAIYEHASNKHSKRLLTSFQRQSWDTSHLEYRIFLSGFLYVTPLPIYTFKSFLFLQSINCCARARRGFVFFRPYAFKEQYYTRKHIEPI